MDSQKVEFSKPFNWCDRQCERCPLSERCEVMLREKQQRWQDEARGLDPDDPEQIWKHVEEELERAMRMVQQAAEEEGIDLDAPMPPPVVVLEAERLERAGMRIATALAKYRPADDAQADAVDECKRLTIKLVGKVVRIAGYLGHDKGEVWDLDGAPNALLVERVRAELLPALEAVEPLAPPDDSALAAFRKLDALLVPLFARVSAEARAELLALEARGEAPSPFLGGRNRLSVVE